MYNLILESQKLLHQPIFVEIPLQTIQKFKDMQTTKVMLGKDLRKQDWNDTNKSVLEALIVVCRWIL